MGLERSYILRVLAFFCVIANLLLALIHAAANHKILGTWEEHILYALLALPLLIGSHTIIKKYEIAKTDSISQIRTKGYESDKWFARMMFSYFGIIFFALFFVFFLLPKL